MNLPALAFAAPQSANSHYGCSRTIGTHQTLPAPAHPEQETEAARAYDRALVRLRGPGAATNFTLSE